MKKKLLYLTSIALFSVASINAQTKVWDFGANPMGAGFTDMITVANQTTCSLYPAGSLTGGVEAGNQVSTIPTTGNTATFGILTITSTGDRWRSDNTSLVLYDQTLNNLIAGSAVKPVFTGATTSGRFVFAGNGVATVGGQPVTRRGLTFALTAGQTITIYWKQSVTAAGTVKVFPPAGSSVATTIAYPARTALSEMITTKFTADVAGNYLIRDDVNKPEIYRIYDADVNAGINLSTDGFEQDASLDVFSIKNQVYVSNVVSNTKINVYSVLGSLIKSVSTSENTSFELNSGVYIVKAQSAEGTKSVKVIVQ